MNLFVYQLHLRPAYHDYSAWDDVVQETLAPPWERNLSSSQMISL
jgi:hypothetical protein